MFTGIVEETGKVQSLGRKKNLSLLKISARKVTKGVRLGGSMAVDGACLTVVEIKNHVLAFDMMKATLSTTTLGRLKPGDEVNLERSLKLNGRVHGHFMTGHIDQAAAIKARIKRENYIELRFPLSKAIKQYIVPKGSVAVDGVSLTVGGVAKDSFSVYLIPFTKQVTTLAGKKKGDRVNIETDILAKYVLKRGQLPLSAKRGLSHF